MSTDTRSWTTKTLEDLEDLYWTEMAAGLRADGFDPEREHPPYRWLVESGYSGFIRSLKRDHGLTPTEFYVDVLGIDPDDEPYWPTSDERTVEYLDGYLQELRDRRGHPATTVGTRRSRLRRYVATYTRLHGREDLVSPVEDRDQRPEEIERVMAVYDALDDELGTAASKFKYLEDPKQWYAFLADSGLDVYNPLEPVARRFNWSRPEWDNQPLDARHVRELYASAASRRERMLILGLAGWGLRPSELAALHVRQVHIDPDDDDRPYIRFRDGERKNGPGTVSLLVGVGVLRERLDELADGAGWSGYVFPSEQSQGGHRSPDTLRRWFAGVAERADVRVDGERPTPKMGRRFWYSAYSSVIEDVVESLEDIAADQGSADPLVVYQNYLSEQQRRELRREPMAEVLRRAFDG